MDIVVCIKRVPETTEAEVVVDETGEGIREEGLVFDINEADNYALEEALLLKEKFGGSVLVLTLGPEEADETVRSCLAKGADSAIRLTHDSFKGSDGNTTAKILSMVIKDLDFDLVLTGIQADDDAWGQVGVQLAELLAVPHAALVTNLEVEGESAPPSSGLPSPALRPETQGRGKRSRGAAKVHRELEGGLEEVLELKLPAVLTIQTGINEPRYASLRGMKKARELEIRVLGLEEIGLREDDVGEAGSKTKVEKLSIPVVESKAEILEGTPEETSGRLAEILREKGAL